MTHVRHPSLSAAMVGLLATASTAVLLTVRQQPLAESDLLLVLIYSLGFAILLWAVFRRFELRIQTANAGQAYTFGLVLGFLVACVWQGFIGLMMGGWVLTLGVPVLLCWVAGGLSAGIALGWFYCRSIPHLLRAVAVSVIVVFAATHQMLANPKTVTVILRENTSEQFLRSVIGMPGSTPTEHGFIDGVVGARVGDRGDGRQIVEVQLRARLSNEVERKIVARIKSYSPVESVMVSSDRGTVASRRVKR